MKNTDDRKIYLSIIIVPLIIAAVIGGISLYSKAVIEPKVKKLIASDTGLTEGYLLLREPQLFGGYKYWDTDGMAVKNSLRYFDAKIYRGAAIVPDERVYLELILGRRESGSVLGIKSAFFLLIVSFAAAAAYIIERRKLKE